MGNSGIPQVDIFYYINKAYQGAELPIIYMEWLWKSNNTTCCGCGSYVYA